MDSALGCFAKQWAREVQLWRLQWATFDLTVGGDTPTGIIANWALLENAPVDLQPYLSKPSAPLLKP